MIKNFFVLCFFVVLCFSAYAQISNKRIILGEKHARQQVKQALKKKYSFSTILINDKETAIAIAEPILFKLYGKKNILAERPYEIYLINGYWYITGTLPLDYKGGTFEIIIRSKNGEVIKLVHYK